MELLKVFDLEKINLKLKEASSDSEEVPEEVETQAQRIRYLLELLSNDYINEEILTVPLEEWYKLGEKLYLIFNPDFDDEEDLDPVIAYLHKNDYSTYLHNRIYMPFLNTKPSPMEDFI